MSAEYIQFAGALVFFLAILIGSYWFVYAPTRNNYKRDREKDRFGE